MPISTFRTERMFLPRLGVLSHSSARRVRALTLCRHPNGRPYVDIHSAVDLFPFLLQYSCILAHSRLFQQWYRSRDARTGPFAIATSDADSTLRCDGHK